MCNSHSTPFKWYRIVPFFSFRKSFILPLEQNLNEVRDLFSNYGHMLRFLVDMISWDTIQPTAAAKMVYGIPEYCLPAHQLLIWSRQLLKPGRPSESLRRKWFMHRCPRPHLLVPIPFRHLTEWSLSEVPLYQRCDMARAGSSFCYVEKLKTPIPFLLSGIYPGCWFFNLMFYFEIIVDSYWTYSWNI